jgi:hypothetical protein
MSLFDKLKDTKFKSLKFGNDSFGGGDSLEPFIQKPIRDDNPLGVRSNLRDVATENKNRISKLLDTSRGAKFISTQKGLTLSNTRLEPTSKSNAKTRISPLIIYNPNNTLAQIGENPETGTHFDRFGLTPFIDDSYKYLSIVTKNNKLNNRLTNLYKDLNVGITPNNRLTDFKSGVLNAFSSVSGFLNTITGISNIFGGSPFLNNLNNKVNQITKIATPYLSPTIDQYNGGPNSKYGVGFTSIRRFDYTNNTDKTDTILKLGKYNIGFDRRTNQSRNLLNQDPKKGTLLVTNLFTKYGGDTKFEFKYTNAREIKNSVYSLTPNVNGEVDYNDIIKKSKDTELKTHTVLEKTNTSGITYTYKTSKKSPESIKSGNIVNFINGKLNAYTDDTIDDRMPIQFTIINPFTGNAEKVYSFSAYLNGFKDTSSPSHTEISYIGRSEHFYVYNKFKRDVSFNFQIPCFSLFELREKHRLLAALYSSTMGKYNDNNKLVGILYKLKLGNYLNNESGIITSISYDIPNDSPWDIDEQLAQNINVSVSFTVIHNKLPQYDPKGTLFTIEKPILEGINMEDFSKQIKRDIFNINSTVNKFGEMVNLRNTPIPSSVSNSTTKSSSGMLGMSQ